VSLRRGTTCSRPVGVFLCRYVERTIAQLGEEALDLPLVSRHLAACPVCRAQRRRISRVDDAFRQAMIGETPGWFDGRWEDLCDRVPDLQRRPPREREERSLLVGAAVALLVLLGSAWHADHRAAPEPIPTVLAEISGVTVTGVAVNGKSAEVAVDSEVGEEGAVVLWVRPDGAVRSEAGGFK